MKLENQINTFFISLNNCQVDCPVLLCNRQSLDLLRVRVIIDRHIREVASGIVC